MGKVTIERLQQNWQKAQPNMNLNACSLLSMQRAGTVHCLLFPRLHSAGASATTRHALHALHILHARHALHGLVSTQGRFKPAQAAHEAEKQQKTWHDQKQTDRRDTCNRLTLAQTLVSCSTTTSHMWYDNWMIISYCCHTGMYTSAMKTEQKLLWRPSLSEFVLRSNWCPEFNSRSYSQL